MPSFSAASDPAMPQVAGTKTIPTGMIKTAIDDRLVATVVVNNPEQRNALGNAGKRELA